MAPPVPLGRFVWFDLMTSDPKAAVAFYTSTMGWGTDSWQSPAEGMPPYTMWTANGTAIGGTMQLPPGAPAPPHWLGYISTPDIDATVAKASGLGARVMMPPTAIPTVGRFAVLADPQGAVFAVFTPAADTPGHEGPANLGEVSWFELGTSDHDKALEFYGALFGWEKQEAMDMGPLGVYQLWGRNGQPMGGAYTIAAGMPMPPCWAYYVRVADLDAAVGRCGAGGGQVIQPPMDIPGGRISICSDPQGAMFAMHEVAA